MLCWRSKKIKKHNYRTQFLMQLFSPKLINQNLLFCFWISFSCFCFVLFCFVFISCFVLFCFFYFFFVLGGVVYILSINDKKQRHSASIKWFIYVYLHIIKYLPYRKKKQKQKQTYNMIRYHCNAKKNKQSSKHLKLIIINRFFSVKSTTPK